MSKLHQTLNGPIVPVGSSAWMDDLKRRVDEAKDAMELAQSNARTFRFDARAWKRELAERRRRYRAARSSIGALTDGVEGRANE
jgi:hypothetical protein